MSSAQQLDGLDAEGMVGSAKDNNELRNCRWGERKTYLHSFYYRHVFRDGKVKICTVLRETDKTAREGLSNRALNEKLYSLGKQERKFLAEVARLNAKLKKKLKTTEEMIPRAGAHVRGKGQDTIRRTAKIGGSTGSGRRRNANGSAEVKSPTREKRK